MFKEFIEITEEINEAKFERFDELKEILEIDPWALVRVCAEENGLDTSSYLDLYNHVLPQVCKDRLDVLGNDFRNQPIKEGNVPLANIDYYGVEMTSRPDFNGDGFPDTDAQIYNAFRNKFTELASGEKEDFQFTCNVPLNISNNPLTAIMLIKAGASGFLTNLSADEGAVIVSEFTPTDFTVSTITTDDTGTQPFSGNRQWGYVINDNGNLELFTRAVDVAKVSDLIRKDPRGDIGCQQNDYYNVAETTWDNMQQEIADWIDDNGGTFTVIPKVAKRVNKAQIEKLLIKNETIDQINCN